jgi:hypothetical protein
LHWGSAPAEVSDLCENGDKSIVRAATERRKRLSAQNYAAESKPSANFGPIRRTGTADTTVLKRPAASKQPKANNAVSTLLTR